jgi:hypothetical protein
VTNDAIQTRELFEPLDLSGLSLDDFRHLASRWANSFDHEYRTLLYVLSDIVDLRTSIARVGMERLRERMQEAYDRQGDGIKAPSTRTIQRRLDALREHGIVSSYQPRTAAEWKLRPQFRTNRYECDFKHIVSEGRRADYDFLAPPEPESMSDGLSSSPSGELATVPSISPSQVHLTHQAEVTEAREGPSYAGASPRTPEEREEVWFRAFAADLESLLNVPVGVAGVRKACQGMTHLDYPQAVRPLLQSWVADKMEYIASAQKSPVHYVLGTFPHVWAEERSRLDPLLEEVFERGEETGLLKALGGEWPSDFMLLDADGSVVDEWSAAEFEYLMDDPANAYALLRYFDGLQTGNYPSAGHS